MIKPASKPVAAYAYIWTEDEVAKELKISADVMKAIKDELPDEARSGTSTK